VSYAAGTNPQAVAVSDFNSDGKLDLVVANAGSNNVSVLLGNGNGTFQPAKTFAVGGDPLSVAVGDFNGDGKPDIVTANGSGSLSILLGNGDGTFQPAQSLALTKVKIPNGLQESPIPLAVAVGDLDNDGKADLVVIAYLNGPVSGGYFYQAYVEVLTGKGNGSFNTPTSVLIASQQTYGYELYPSAVNVALGDFNGDGNVDVVAGDGIGNVDLLLGAGNGNLQAPTNVAAGYAVTVGDFNGDRKLDLATNGNGVTVLLGNGNGTFQSATNYNVGGSPASLAVGDFNHDGNLDIVTVDGATNKVSVMPGIGNGAFRPAINVAAGSQPVALSAADFNGDGYPDLAVADNGSSSVSVLLNDQNWSGATTLIVSGIPPVTTAGVQSFTITVENSFGQVVRNYTGTVHFTSTDPQAVLPTDYTFNAGDQGVHAFTATLKTAGTQTITAADTADANLTESDTTTVNPAAASTIVAVGNYPMTYSIDSGPFLFIFQAFDPYGNAAVGSTFNISSSDPLATFPSPLTVPPYIGAGIFDFDAAFGTVGAQTLAVTEATNPNVTVSVGINVGPWAAVNAPPTQQVPNIGYGGPDAEVAVNEPVSYTLTAGGGGIPSGAIFTFTVDWGETGIPLQTLTGPSGTTVSHTYTTGGTHIQITATYNGFTGGFNAGGSAGSSPPQPVFGLSVGFIATIQPDPGDPSQYALVFHVNGGDSLTLSPTANNGVIKLEHIDGQTTPITINPPGNAPFAHLLIYGDSRPHQISLTGGLAVPALIFADGTLDASGSIANNVLVGQRGNDTLKGGSGRDILIVGAGAGTLDAGGGDDILIGGYSSFDNNIIALLAIMAEWGRTDADYNTRVAHLQGTQSAGLNGSYLLNASTVFDNGVVDLLDGGAGMDWFLVGTSGKNKDMIKNERSGEVVTSI
jgi:hypothetical protein